MKKFALYLMLFLFSFNSLASERSLTTADRLDIIDVINNYGLAVDNKNYDLFRSLFFDDVEARLVFDPSFFGGEEIIINGLDKWVSYIKESGALFKTSQHLIANSPNKSIKTSASFQLSSVSSFGIGIEPCALKIFSCNNCANGS